MVSVEAAIRHVWGTSAEFYETEHGKLTAAGMSTDRHERTGTTTDPRARRSAALGSLVVLQRMPRSLA